MFKCLPIIGQLKTQQFIFQSLVSEDKATNAIMIFLVLVYSVILSIVFMNTLIAMLNNTYMEIQLNEDTEWKYSRAKLFTVSNSMTVLLSVGVVRLQ